MHLLHSGLVVVAVKLHVCEINAIYKLLQKKVGGVGGGGAKLMQYSSYSRKKRVEWGGEWGGGGGAKLTQYTSYSRKKGGGGGSEINAIYKLPQEELGGGG